ncbi:hypothetical protein PL263_09605 [Methylomonas sp. EFPC3]|uniref:hypothetical protein n=1 Tax=Methylomonas sp. EFPC3 TaxID=3021710 RepID=UPI002417AC03|nr:hypothetical protein [Methylomonas sp. EFPC3]WFP52262.1 hypothetical protein PL263_09605 [Methylomonas sp. EFPC3]
MLKKILICFLIYQYLPSVNANEKSDQVIDFLKTACASGEKVEIEASGDGALSLGNKGLKGKLIFSKSDFRGISEGLNSENQAKNLENVRECMKPYINKIIDHIFGDL